MNEVIVVGTGASATMVARHFAAAGRPVVMLERGLDHAYAPAVLADRWHEETLQSWEYGRLITRNRWSGLRDGGSSDPEKFDDLVAVENLQREFSFPYNMRLGYGGSSAVWSGRTWRFMAEDFATRRLYGYGLDWPISLEDMEPYYDAAEELMHVTGPNEPGWPFKGNYVGEAFPATYLDSVFAKIFAADFDFYATANAVHRKDPREGGCVGAKTCVSFCPSNALFRHYQLLEPLRHSGKVRVVPDRIVTALDVDNDGHVSKVRYTSRDQGDGSVNVARGQSVFLCGNTIENLRILLNSERVSGKKVANSSGLLGAYFGTHGGVVREMTSATGIKPGRTRPTTSAGIPHGLNTDRSRVNAYMAELWNLNWLRGSSRVALEDFRKDTGLIGRALFERAEGLARKAPVSIVFELELRERNRVRLSGARDDWGVPLPQVDVELSERDRATYDHIHAVFERATAHPGCTGSETRAYGLNGNHPIGGYNMGTSRTNSVTNSAGRAWDHPNLYLGGGGLFGSTSPFNPTLTITANTLRCLAEIDRGERT